MSTGIASADWPNNMSADDRKAWTRDQINNWCTSKRIDEVLSTAELGNLSHTQKAVAYRSVLIIGSIKHCRANARAEARIPILTLITYLSDNAKGVCYLSISKMQELFQRSRQCVVDNILALVAEVVRKHWFPKVNASALAAFYIKQGGLCAITGNPMTIDPKDPAAASPFPEWDDWGRMQFFGIACKSAASAQAQRFAKHRV